MYTDFRCVRWIIAILVAPYLNIEIFIITGGEVPSEFQDGVSTFLLPSDQEPVLACINGRQVASLSIAVL